ncbi:hypothetical protein D3C72_2206150 [compost metagenome]
MRASSTVVMRCPWVISTSGAMTAVSAASGAYLRPRLSQSGSGSSFFGIMKNARVMTVITVRPTMAVSW